VAEIRALQQSQVPAGRYGTPQEFGSLCAYICSQQASYITGQNFLTDGGAYPGTY
jgi:3-oxoacyl-[acyl-carrier protein] reductase